MTRHLRTENLPSQVVLYHPLPMSTRMAKKDMAKCEQTGAMIRLDEGNFVGDPFTGEWRFAADAAPWDLGS